VIQTSEVDTNSGESGQWKSPSGIQWRSPERESGGQSLTIYERRFHGDRAECEPITWSGAEAPPGSRGRAPGQEVRGAKPPPEACRVYPLYCPTPVICCELIFF